ncbi:fumarylacetoacetate hydrolase family protein [Glaciimonas sp. PCH181]|uniref:fumarylacetoacetate hydrolase family protein n=1 Tax=Glaciimonas sp. PCH181 TaxID=2133943 RepID=UPI000D35603F|nr:fumarylacetoacetate hydrolase family protein [Glaciimonas sp. PCH181]PUA19496.1 5-carboxymethyl-2-hydroxymuconate delta-isomerase [Glaciimonas sp. PCH181]
MFKLGTFSDQNSDAFVGMVLGKKVVAISIVHAHYRDSSFNLTGTLSAADSISNLLQDWDNNFAVLQAMEAFIGSEDIASDRLKESVYDLSSLRVRPPIEKPSKMLNSAANYREHVAEMSNYTQAAGNVDKTKIFAGDKSTAKPYFFLKAPSALIGAYDDIVLPSGEHQIDWEAEVAVAIGRPGKRIKAAQSMLHVAGFMTANDVTCRDLLWRADRPNFRSDWFASKSFDTFAPMGPFFVPREFVPNYSNLHISLKVNGETKQNGNTDDMIFSLEEQIEYVSEMMTLHSGDIFMTGTIGGVGQSTGTFLKAGDIVETEVDGLGMLRNRVVLSVND